MSPIPPNILTVFRQNLSALETVDPTLAAQISDLDWSSNLVFKPALDGTPSAFGPGLSHSGWFAASGAPRIRETILCEQFSSETSNVILPGSGQGEGLKILLSRFRSWQTVFIHEADLRSIAILLALHDFSADIHNRRIIFLINPDLTKALTDFFAANPEFILPTKMLGWPWLTENDTAALSQSIERAINEITPLINRTIADLRAELESIYKNHCSSGRIEIFSLIDQNTYDQLADDVRWAAGLQDRSVGEYRLSCPEHSGVIGLARYLISSRPDLVVSIGLSRNQWNIPLPPSVRFLSFLVPPGITLPDKSLEALQPPSPNERYIVGNRKNYDLLKNRFGENAALSFFELAVNPETFQPGTHASEFRIGLFANRPPSNPEVYGIRQKSHQTLWQEIGKMIGENPLAFQSSKTDDFLRRGSKRSGVQLTDPDLIKKFTLLIEMNLAPAVIATTLANGLKSKNIPFRIFGSGWENDPEFETLAEPLADTSRNMNADFQRCDIVLCLNPEQLLFDALCAGKPVMVIHSPEILDRYPEIAKGISRLDPQENFIRQVERHLQKLPPLREQTLKAREYLKTHFSFEILLKTLLTV